jgi:cation transport protein ChaC
MPIDSEADVITAASGFIGPCREYPFDTVEALNAEGFRDPHLEKLVALVKQRLAS